MGEGKSGGGEDREVMGANHHQNETFYKIKNVIFHSKTTCSSRLTFIQVQQYII